MSQVCSPPPPPSTAHLHRRVIWVELPDVRRDEGERRRAERRARLRLEQPRRPRDPERRLDDEGGDEQLEALRAERRVVGREVGGLEGRRLRYREEEGGGLLCCALLNARYTSTRACGLRVSTTAPCRSRPMYCAVTPVSVTPTSRVEMLSGAGSGRAAEVGMRASARVTFTSMTLVMTSAGRQRVVCILDYLTGRVK